jgi:hypothetical protein
MQTIFWIREKERFPDGEWSRLPDGVVQDLVGEAVQHKFFNPYAERTETEQLLLKLLAAKFGKALYREGVGFFKPRNSFGRQINWTQFDAPI